MNLKEKIRKCLSPLAIGSFYDFGKEIGREASLMEAKKKFSEEELYWKKKSIETAVEKSSIVYGLFYEGIRDFTSVGAGVFLYYRNGETLESTLYGLLTFTLTYAGFSYFIPSMHNLLSKDTEKR